MNAGMVLVGAAIVTWVLRVAFIAVAPVQRLAPAARRALQEVGPAAIAALAATSLAVALSTGPVAPVLVAAGAASIAAWWRGDLTTTVMVGVGVHALVGWLV